MSQFHIGLLLSLNIKNSKMKCYVKKYVEYINVAWKFKPFFGFGLDTNLVPSVNNAQSWPLQVCTFPPIPPNPETALPRFAETDFAACAAPLSAVPGLGCPWRRRGDPLCGARRRGCGGSGAGGRCGGGGSGCGKGARLGAAWRGSGDGTRAAAAVVGRLLPAGACGGRGKAQTLVMVPLGRLRRATWHCTCPAG